MSDDGYAVWKGWTDVPLLSITARQTAYFAAELRGFPLAGARVLELGFGNGAFLGFCRSRGASVAGTERIAAAIEKARAAGVTVYPPDLGALAERQPQSFDLVAAFDVLEHMPLDKVASVLSDVACLLRPGGRFVARFPNGQSPFGRIHQYGDRTHCSVLSGAILLQLADPRCFTPVYVGNPAEPLSGPVLRRAAQKARQIARSLIETVIGRLYGFDGPLGVNTVVVLDRI